MIVAAMLIRSNRVTLARITSIGHSATASGSRQPIQQRGT